MMITKKSIPFLYSVLMKFITAASNPSPGKKEEEKCQSVSDFREFSEFPADNDVYLLGDSTIV